MGRRNQERFEVDVPGLGLRRGTIVKRLPRAYANVRVDCTEAEAKALDESVRAGVCSRVPGGVIVLGVRIAKLQDPATVTPPPEQASPTEQASPPKSPARGATKKAG